MKVTYRLPSKAIQYGFMEVEADSLDELPDPETLGQVYVNQVYAFLEGEQKGLNNLLAPKVEAAISKDEMDESGAAVEALVEGLGATVISEDEAVASYHGDGPGDVDASHLEAAEELTQMAQEDGLLDEPAKPWDKKVDAKPKPWETESAAPKAAPKVASIDW